MPLVSELKCQCLGSAEGMVGPTTDLPKPEPSLFSWLLSRSLSPLPYSPPYADVLLLQELPLIVQSLVKRNKIHTAGAVSPFHCPFHLVKSPWGCRGQTLRGVAVRDAGLAFGHASSVAQSLAFGSACLPAAGRSYRTRLQTMVSFAPCILVFSLSRMSLASPSFTRSSALQPGEQTCHRLSSDPSEEAVLRAHVDGACWTPGSLRCFAFTSLKVAGSSSGKSLQTKQKSKHSCNT